MESAKNRPALKTMSRWLLLAALLYFSWLMLKITLQYIPIQTDVAFLRIKQQYLEIDAWRIAFFVHVFSSMFALVAGFTQFSATILRKAPKLHRWMGRAYVINILAVTGPSSFIMACFANGGWPSRLAFGILAVLWILTTGIGLKSILVKKIERHKEWMIRSYALTLSAITLRAWKLGLVLMFDPRPLDLYRLVAWLGFVPNLLFAEWLIQKARARKAAVQSRS